MLLQQHIIKRGREFLEKIKPEKTNTAAKLLKPETRE